MAAGDKRRVLMEADIGKEGGVAPAGFGLGSVTAKRLTSADDLNAVRESGLYYWYDEVPQNALPGYGNLNEYVLMEVASAWNGCTAQRFRSLNAKNVVYLRANPTQPYEFVNPPMELGVEYRTTERYMGKPVYVKTFDFAAWTADAVTALNIENIDTITDSKLVWRLGVFGAGATVFDISYRVMADGSVWDSTIGAVGAFKMMGTDNWGGNKLLTVKYTKTTD